MHMWWGERKASDRTSLFFFRLELIFFLFGETPHQHFCNANTHTHTNTRARKREREKDDVEGKKSAVVVAFVLFFASSRLLFSFSFSEMSFIGEKKKQKRIIDDEFVTGGRRRSAIRDGDDDDTER